MRFLFISACSFVLGFVVMSFEMLGSRYLYPYFGGGLNVWAMLISVVLLALMLGYFVGGLVARSYSHFGTIEYSVLFAGIYMLAIPYLADRVVLFCVNNFGDGAFGSLIATVAILMVPLTLLSLFAPYSINVLTENKDQAGFVSGAVYAISTGGNILGILLTSFYLIPSIGVRAITYILASLTIATGVMLTADFFRFRSKNKTRP